MAAGAAAAAASARGPDVVAATCGRAGAGVIAAAAAARNQCRLSMSHSSKSDAESGGVALSIVNQLRQLCAWVSRCLKECVDQRLGPRN